jgi:hypothetical protein
MRRLRDYQPVSLYVGEACVNARVAAVHGDEANITLTDPMPPDAGFLPAQTQLAFEHEGHLIMLSGMLYPARTGDPLRFVIADGVRAADKRRHIRLSVSLEAVATPLGEDGEAAGPTVQATTLDVSAGGILLACGNLSGRVRVAVELPGSAGVIETIGTVVRSGETRTAIAFLALPAEDQATLERFVKVVRTEIARRFAQAA